MSLGFSFFVHSRRCLHGVYLPSHAHHPMIAGPNQQRSQNRTRPSHPLYASRGINLSTGKWLRGWVEGNGRRSRRKDKKTRRKNVSGDEGFSLVSQKRDPSSSRGVKRGGASKAKLLLAHPRMSTYHRTDIPPFPVRRLTRLSFFLLHCFVRFFTQPSITRLSLLLFRWHISFWSVLLSDSIHLARFSV